MITIDAVSVCVLPITPKDMGLLTENGQGNAVLLLAEDLPPDTRDIYQRTGYIRDGVCISMCSEQLNHVLASLHLHYRSWPEHTITLALLNHTQLGVLADRLVIAYLSVQADAHPATFDEKET